MVKLKDVMEKAKVSSGTVSRVINNHPDVSDETRQKVLKCIREIGYVPNETARKLRMSNGNKVNCEPHVKTHNIACILFEGYDKFSEPYFSEILDGIDKESFSLGYQLFTYTADQLNSNSAVFNRMINPESIDGLILLNSTHLITELKDRIKSMICLNCSEESLDSIDVDREQGVFKAVRYLAGLGHSKIAFVGDFQNRKGEKFQAYCKALSELGIKYYENMVAVEGNGIEAGYKGINEIFAKGASPTAVFGASDMTAIGVMKALKERGLKIPDDISLAGYDDIESSQVTSPPLTTIRINKRNLGILGVRKLLERISYPAMQPVKTMISPELVVRGSCGKLNG